MVVEHAASPLDVIRVLQSKDLSLNKKVEAAWGSLPLLAGSETQTSVAGGQLGLLHFARYMLQWSLSTLIKVATEGHKKRTVESEDLSTLVKPATEGQKKRPFEGENKKDSKKSVKRRKTGQQYAESAAWEARLELPEGGEAPAYLDVRLWRVLKATLLSERLGNDALISPAILQAMSAVLLSSQTLSSASAADLGEVVSEVQEVLAARFASSFRPSLEQWAAAAQVAIGCLTAFSPEHPKGFVTPTPFRKALLPLVRGLDRTCRSHPNPRKVFTLLVGRLLRPVLTARFCFLGANDLVGSVSPEETVLALESLLEGGLFHVAQVVGYAGVCQSLEPFTDNAVKETVAVNEAEAGSKKGRRKQGAAVAQDEEAKGKLASYHRLLFQELEAGVNEHDQAVIGSLDWFLRAYAAAMEQEPNEDAGLTDTDHRKSDLDAEDAAPSERAPPEAARRKKLPHSEVLFQFFAQLMRPLVQQMQAGGGKAEALVGLVRGSRLLLAAANEVHAYIPTEDTPSRAHLRFLTMLKTSVLGLSGSTSPSITNFQEHVEKAKPASRALHQDKSVFVGQILSFLAVVIETEYRVIDEDLTLVWSLLLRAANEGGERRGLDSAPRNLEEWLAHKALKLGVRLLDVYSDLRQVERLLTNLTEALQSASHRPRLVCSAPFLRALFRVVQKLPMGQVAPLVRMVARDQQALLEGIATGQRSAYVASATELHVSILDHLHVSEGNAVAVGAASRAVLHSAVAPSLGPKLLTWSLTSAQTQPEDLEQKSTHRTAHRKPNGAPLRVVEATEGEGFESLMMLWTFLSANSLHSHAVSLMPPTAAKRAEAAVLGLDRNPCPDQTLSSEKRSIFASLGCGQLQVSKVVAGLGTRLATSPPLHYAVDCLALQELERLSRLRKRLELGLESESETAALRDEIAALLEVLLPKSKPRLQQMAQSGLGPKPRNLENDRQATPSTNDGSDDILGSMNGWDAVVSNLIEASYSTAKWRLLCQSVDVWGPLARPQECGLFLQALLDTAQTEDARSRLSPHDSLQRRALAPSLKCLQEVEEGPMSGGDVETSLRMQIAREARMDLILSEPPTLITASACSQELLRDAAFYEQPAFQSRLPLLLLAKLRSLSADISTRGGGKDLMMSAKRGSVTQIPSPLEQAGGLLQFLGQLERGYMRTHDVGESLEVLMQLERSLLLVAQSHATPPPDRSALLLHLVLCRTTMSRILANNSTILFHTPAAAALGTNGAAERQASFSETFWEREVVKGLLTAAQACALAGVNRLEGFVLPVIASTKEALHTLVVSALEAVNFAPLQAPKRGEPITDSSIDMSDQGEDTHEQAGGFLDIVLELILDQCEQARAVLSADRSTRQAEAHSGPQRPEPSALLPRTLLLAAKQKDLVNPRAVSRSGFANADGEKVEQAGKRWVEAASSMANAGGVLRAFAEILGKRDQACRAGREAEMTWQAPNDMWEDVVGRLERAVTECLSILTGDAGKEGGNEPDAAEGEQVAPKGRRVLRGSLKGLEQRLLRAGQDAGEEEQARVAKHAERLRSDVSSLANLDWSTWPTLKRALMGELFAAVGYAVRIRCLFASPHVSLPLQNFVGTELTVKVSGSVDQQDQGEESSKAGEKKAARKRQQADSGNGALDGSEALNNGSRKKRRKKSATEVAPSELETNADTYRGGHNGSPALESLGRHLAAAGNVLATLLQRIKSSLHGSGLNGDTEDIVQSTQVVSSVVNYLEAAGRSFPILSPAPPIAAFDWLVERHLALLAALAASTSKAQRELKHALSAVRSGAEASLGTLIKGASRQQLMRVIQTLETDLIDRQRKEAAVSGLAVLLEYVSAPKSLRLLASHSPRLLSVLVSLFQADAATSAALLTSALHVLTTFVSRESQFHLTAAQVGLTLSVGLLSANQLLPAGSDLRTASRTSTAESHHSNPASSVQNDDVADPECNTFCAISRLLQAILRHRPKDVRRCAALLVGSMQSMLQIVATWSQVKGRERSAVIACASLRRAYEEVSNHKASLSHYCVHMLADYLAALCGITATKDAISREAASTLRSGIFALFDSCSPYDLQQLHASLGADGTRRNALTALRQDYEKRHKYTGKV